MFSYSVIFNELLEIVLFQEVLNFSFQVIAILDFIPNVSVIGTKEICVLLFSLFNHLRQGFT